MSNVRQFPQDRNLKTQLEELQSQMEKLYESLNEGYELLNRLEEKCTELEGTYNNTLERYGNAVGIDNIPVGFLEYATKNITLEDGGTEIMFKWEPENEET